MSALVHLLRDGVDGPRVEARGVYCGRGNELGQPVRASTHPTEVTCLRCLSTAVTELQRDLAVATLREVSLETAKAYDIVTTDLALHAPKLLTSGLLDRERLLRSAS